MLQHIREKFTGVFAIVLLSVLALSFVFFGIGNFNFLNAGNAAVVDDVEISIFQLENAYQNQLLQLSDFSNLPPETLQLIRRNTLERLIRDALVDVYVDKAGYRIGDEQIAELIQQEPTFQVDGVFSKEAYYNWLEQQVIDARVFEASQRAAMRNSQVQRGIGATAFVTPSEYRRYLNLFAEERVVSLATFDIAALADTIVVDDEDVQAFYDSRPDAFRADESVDFQYVEIDRSALVDAIEVAEEELQQYYDVNASRFLQDESRSARHILITFDGDEAAAEELAASLTARAQAGEPFEDLARQYSKDGGTAQRGGDLGTMLQTQMEGPLGDAIFSIAEG
jgi:peptidyl-prolyl cis-trans isomerase D